MIVYVVTMQRYGDSESHHYLDGIYTCLANAYIEGIKHAEFRDNKYEPLIQEVEVDDSNALALQISWNTALLYAKMKYPEKFDDQGKLKEE